ncbi:MFS transporter [Novosphingobium terrae]|uniref:MFS transporter n=1 Tax=Novosphingobium terrae TaxID=2726189 RepID=UPI00198113D6|nr:MFS transporter [Novosphingobium terrae]
MSSQPIPAAAPQPEGGAYAPFAHRDFRLFFLARLVNSFGTNIMMPALGWQIYAMTHSPLALGVIGIVVFVPVMLTSIPAGQIADRFERRTAYRAAQVVLVANAALFCGLSLAGTRQLWPFYLGAAIFGAGKTLSMPVATAWMPHLIPREQFPRAVSWTSSTWQISSATGPVLAGWAIYAGGEALIYGLAALCYGMSLLCAHGIAVRSKGGGAKGTGLAGLFGGLSYIGGNRLLLGLISLDVVALFLGGATALLPAYAYDVLHVGERGFGLLRAAPACGSLAMGMLLAHRPLRRGVGVWLFGSVALYGVATVAFGLSRSLPLSLAALLVLGSAETTGNFIRQTLVQLSTHDDMRGRVTAVMMMFGSARSELGEMESGFLASLIGVVPAVAAGGVAVVLVAGLWLRMFPALGRIDRLLDAVVVPDRPQFRRIK